MTFYYHNKGFKFSIMAAYNLKLHVRSIIKRMQNSTLMFPFLFKVFFIKPFQCRLFLFSNKNNLPYNILIHIKCANYSRFSFFFFIFKFSALFPPAVYIKRGKIHITKMTAWRLIYVNNYW